MKFLHNLFVFFSMNLYVKTNLSTIEIYLFKIFSTVESTYTPLYFCFTMNERKMWIVSTFERGEQLWTSLNITKFYCICTKTDFFFLNRSTHFKLTPHKKNCYQTQNNLFSLFFPLNCFSWKREFCPGTLLSFPSTKPLILCISINIKLNMSKLQNTVKRGILQDYYTN